MTVKEKIWVLAAGGPGEDEGGSGFLEMVEQSRTVPPILDAEIVLVTSNHPKGGVYHKAHELDIPFDYWPGPYTAEGYTERFLASRAGWIMCSGWLKYVLGLPMGITANIHPGLKKYGGLKMHGDAVHQAFMADYAKGMAFQSAVTMHFVNTHPDAGYDTGPSFFELPVPARPDDTWETYKKRVNERERAWQSYMLNHVVQGRIYLQNGIVRFRDGAPRILIPQ